MMEERLKFLFLKYAQNNCSREEMEELFAYIREAGNDGALRDCVHRVYEDIRRMDPSFTYVDESGRLSVSEAGDMNVQEEIIFSGQDDVPGENSLVRDYGSFSKKSALSWKLPVLAVIAVIAGLGIYFFAGTNKENAIARASFTKKFSGRAEQKHLLLPDGTEVWLNAASTLEYPDYFKEGKREVYLHGEAFFNVKKSTGSPFVILTGEVNITVLGTSFNVKAYPGEKETIVSVSEGRVKVNRKEQVLATLGEGQRIKIPEQGKMNFEEKKVDVSEVAAWQAGNIMYDDENIRDVLADMERVYNVNIRLIEGPQTDGLKISTSFRRELGIEQALQILCRLTDTKLKLVDNEYIIQ